MNIVDLNLLKQLIHGAAVTEQDGMFQFSRFTEEQRSAYSNNSDFFQKTFATSSVSLEFETDASSFTMDVSVSRGSSRLFYYFDIVLNGVLIHSTGAESYQERPEFHLEIPLDGKRNHICIYFPNLVKISMKHAVFKGASFIEPVQKHFRLVSFGDSITQGYDALHPSLAYPTQLANALDAEVFNKGIGGDFFNPGLASFCEPVKPDLITVAYGTNDWSRGSRDQLIQDTERFFQYLAKLYPGTPVLTILPIWRKDFERNTNVGSFADVYEIIRNTCAAHPDVQLVDGMKLVPHLDDCFRPDGLHPNDFGFQFMGRNLVQILQESEKINKK